jgi:hypothetical protein
MAKPLQQAENTFLAVEGKCTERSLSARAAPGKANQLLTDYSQQNGAPLELQLGPTTVLAMQPLASGGDVSGAEPHSTGRLVTTETAHPFA